MQIAYGRLGKLKLPSKTRKIAPDRSLDTSLTSFFCAYVRSNMGQTIAVRKYHLQQLTRVSSHLFKACRPKLPLFIFISTAIAAWPLSCVQRLIIYRAIAPLFCNGLRNTFFFRRWSVVGDGNMGLAQILLQPPGQKVYLLLFVVQTISIRNQITLSCS